MKQKKTVSRRNFLAAVGASPVAIGATTSLSAKSYSRIVGANDRLGVGVIGAGGMGTSHIEALKAQAEAQNLDPIAVADCWKTRAEAGAATLEAPNVHTDYKKLLEHKEIDYVTIATPEHWHCPMTLDAFDAGKHIYCEKPMTHSIDEGLKVVAKQKETGLKMQVGVQALSDDSFESARQAIDEGLIGQVVHAQIEYVLSLIHI